MWYINGATPCANSPGKSPSVIDLINICNSQFITKYQKGIYDGEKRPNDSQRKNCIRYFNYPYSD